MGLRIASEIRLHNRRYAAHLVKRSDWPELKKIWKAGRIPTAFLNVQICAAKASNSPHAEELMKIASYKKPAK